MNTDHIKAVFREYLADPHAQYAILINGPWGSGKTYFWDNELKPVAVTAGKEPLYVSLNGISSRAVLEQLLFIRMWKFLNRGENPRKSQFLQLMGNAASAWTRKKLDMNLPELLRGLALESGINDHYLLCFDDLERCQLPLPETLGFINDFVEHYQLKVLILSDESKVSQSQADFAGIKEKVIGRTLNFQPDHALILPRLLERYATDNGALAFLRQQEPFIRGLLTSFQEDNLRIIDGFLAAVVRMYPVFSERNEKAIREALLCALTISIDYKRGRLTSTDTGDYKELSVLEMVEQQTSNPGQDTGMLLPDFIKGTYARDFFLRFLRGQEVSFHLWKPVFDFILSGYLDEPALRAEFDARDPDLIPECPGQVPFHGLFGDIQFGSDLGVGFTFFPAQAVHHAAFLGEFLHGGFDAGHQFLFQQVNLGRMQADHVVVQQFGGFDLSFGITFIQPVKHLVFDCCPKIGR